VVFYIKELYRRYIDDQVAVYGAEMAYYFLLSVFPFLIFITTLIGYLPYTGDNFLEYMANLLPYESYLLVRKNVDQVIHTRNLKLLSFGFISMVWASASGMGAVIRGINRALCQKDNRPFWVAIPLSILFTVLAAMSIIFFIILLIFSKQVGAYLLDAGMPQLYWRGWKALRYLLAILILMLVFGLLYRYSPCIKVRWRNAIPGTIFATVGWLLVSWIFSWYVNHFWNLSLIYGSIGGIIGLLIWLYISAQLIILGGELNALLLLYPPGKNAKKIPES
jgi:membrane protein